MRIHVVCNDVGGRYAVSWHQQKTQAVFLPGLKKLMEDFDVKFYSFSEVGTCNHGSRLDAILDEALGWASESHCFEGCCQWCVVSRHNFVGQRVLVLM